MDCRKGLVKAIFLSLLNYGNRIYSQAAATTLKPLDSSHHSAIRFITGGPYNAHQCLLYNKVGGTSLAQRRDKYVSLVLYKALTGPLPLYISSILDWTARIHQGSSDYPLTLQHPRAELGTSAFRFCAPITSSKYTDDTLITSMHD